MRREITVTGKSRAFVNDTPVSLNVLRELSIRLLDIHSQHENLLSTENYQLQVVDTIAQNQTELTDYQIAFDEWNKAVGNFRNSAARLPGNQPIWIIYNFNSTSSTRQT